jgi:hypothetical protein
VFGIRERGRWIVRLTIAVSTAALLLPALATGAGAQSPARASVNDVTVTEGTGGTTTATFVVSLSQSDGSTTVNYTTFDQTAFSGSDYSGTSGTLAFARNETQKTVSVPVVTDSLDEPDEIFGIQLTRVFNGTFEGGDPTGYATILDDDAAPTISIGDATVTEGTGGTTMTTVNVSLSAPSGRPISVDFTTADGSATFDPGADYHRLSGRVEFDRGDTMETLQLTIVADAQDESNETFSVNLSNPSGAGLSKAQATVTIVDDDSAGGGGGGGSSPSISISDVQVVEGDGSTTNVAITVSLSSSSSAYVSVDYATADGTARFSDGDYWRRSGNLVFSPGDTSEALIATIQGDDIDEFDEVFYFDLSNPRSGTLADSRGSVTILDDDSPGGGGGGGGGGGSNPSISIADAQVVEGDGSTATVAITVSLSTSSSAYVAVDYATADGTARFSDGDYWRMSGGIVFSPGDVSKTLIATIQADEIHEIDEVFHLDLSDPMNGTLGDSRGTITILDDDALSSTRTTLTIVQREDRLVARGTVTPAHPGEEMVVVLRKLRNGRFRTIDRATPSLSSAADSDGDGEPDSRYRTSFARPRRGTCLMKATFRGDGDHAKSFSLGRFQC